MQNESTSYPPSGDLPRIVIVLNEREEVGRVLNAASHLALGFGASADAETRSALMLQNYRDASGESHSNISALGIIVLKANGNQLRLLHAKAIDAQVPIVDFLTSMTGGSYIEQLERTRSISAENLEYLGVLLYGVRSTLDPLTKRFSLYKSS